jgi:hypothetical protein
LQKQKVGIVLDGEDLSTAESTLSHSGDVSAAAAEEDADREPDERVKIIPLQSNDPAHRDLVSSTVSQGQGWILRSSVSAENFSDKFSSSNYVHF